MKKKIVILFMTLILSVGLTGCDSKEGNYQESTVPIDYSVLLNSGSCFVYTFKDEETGVWYICTSKGITPRLNSDGSLYGSE